MCRKGVRGKREILEGKGETKNCTQAGRGRQKKSRPKGVKGGRKKIVGDRKRCQGTKLGWGKRSPSEKKPQGEASQKRIMGWHTFSKGKKLREAKDESKNAKRYGTKKLKSGTGGRRAPLVGSKNENAELKKGQKI